MSGIDSISQIVAALRTQLAQGAGAAPAKPRKATSRGGSEKSNRSISKLIAQRVKSLRPDDPNRGKKAFRIFLESVLLNEFGEQLIDDTVFYQMVDEIQEVMEADIRTATAINTAVSTLLGGPQNLR